MLDDRLELVVLSELGVSLVLAEDPRELRPDAAVPVDERPVAVESRPPVHEPDFTGGRNAPEPRCLRSLTEAKKSLDVRLEP